MGDFGKVKEWIGVLLETMTVKQLRKAARMKRISIVGCTKKHELVQAVTIGLYLDYIIRLVGTRAQSKRKETIGLHTR